MLLPRGPHGNFNVLPQRREKFHQASDGEITGTVSHQQGNPRLLHAEDLGDLDLFQAATLENRIDLQRELRLEQLLLGIGEPQVGEYVAASLGHPGNSLASLFRPSFHSGSARSAVEQGALPLFRLELHPPRAGLRLLPERRGASPCPKFQEAVDGGELAPSTLRRKR
jgi:hypothetical protein